MSRSLVYSSSMLYEMVMLVLYRTHYWKRQQVVADLIPDGSKVIDVCCGPGVIFDRFLRRRNIEYTGIDFNERFLKRLSKSGAQVMLMDMTAGGNLPQCDIAIMQASLYQFLPSARDIVEQLRRCARSKVIISEPVRNMANSPVAALRWLARRNTDPGSGTTIDRFDERSFRALAESFGDRVESIFELPGGRELCMVVRSESAD